MVRRPENRTAGEGQSPAGGEAAPVSAYFDRDSSTALLLWRFAHALAALGPALPADHDERLGLLLTTLRKELPPAPRGPVRFQRVPQHVRRVVELRDTCAALRDVAAELLSEVRWMQGECEDDIA